MKLAVEHDTTDLQDGLREILKQHPDAGFTEEHIASIRMFTKVDHRDLPRIRVDHVKNITIVQ